MSGAHGNEIEGIFRAGAFKPKVSSKEARGSRGCERSAEVEHIALYLSALCKTGNGLVDNG